MKEQRGWDLKHSSQAAEPGTLPSPHSTLGEGPKGKACPNSAHHTPSHLGSQGGGLSEAPPQYSETQEARDFQGWLGMWALGSCRVSPGEAMSVGAHRLRVCWPRAQPPTQPVPPVSVGGCCSAPQAPPAPPALQLWTSWRWRPGALLRSARRLLSAGSRSAVRLGGGCWAHPGPPHGPEALRQTRGLAVDTRPW